MGQVTIYLDDESERRLRSAASAAGVPVSRWVAELIQGKTRTEWPAPVKALAGQWADFPDIQMLREIQAEDSAREAF